MLEKNKLLTRGVVVIFALLVIAYVIQGVRSAYRLYPSKLGYQVRAFDVTPRWIGTKNLLYLGIDPYSEQGCDFDRGGIFWQRPETRRLGHCKGQAAFCLPPPCDFSVRTDSGDEFPERFVGHLDCRFLDVCCFHMDLV